MSFGVKQLIRQRFFICFLNFKFNLLNYFSRPQGAFYMSKRSKFVSVTSREMHAG